MGANIHGIFNMKMFCPISAEAANRASIMGAFVKPDNLQGNHGGSGAGGRRGSDPRRATAMEHLANATADMRPGKILIDTTFF